VRQSETGTNDLREETVRTWDTRTGLPANQSPRNTILTIRVSKVDIEALGKGNLTPEQFREKARITTYAGAANSGFPVGGGAFGGGGGGFGGGGFGASGATSW
jgi:hypothetical protein